MSYDTKKGLSLETKEGKKRAHSQLQHNDGDLFDIRLVGSFNFNARKDIAVKLTFCFAIKRRPIVDDDG